MRCKKWQQEGKKGKQREKQREKQKEKQREKEEDSETWPEKAMKVKFYFFVLSFFYFLLSNSL